MICWFDLSPLRPGEYWATDAEQWTEAVMLKNAATEGMLDARSEAGAYARLNSAEVGQVG